MLKRRELKSSPGDSARGWLGTAGAWLHGSEYAYLFDSLTSSMSSSKRCREGVAVDVVEEACAVVSLRYARSLHSLHTMATRLDADIIACLGIPLRIISEVREADIETL